MAYDNYETTDDHGMQIYGIAKDQTFTSTGKRQVKKGTPADASAVIYELIPSDGSMVFYFQAEGDSLTMLNQELQKAASDLNYTLKLVQ